MSIMGVCECVCLYYLFIDIVMLMLFFKCVHTDGSGTLLSLYPVKKN